ncbi:AraC-type DNA-binding protein [Solimonas aquatica]|uniref:AraC-type DNA-binding protein n=1 Tax=Solimonas aquatica TaxID=489703 RepID=A0A1H9G335_9GAMM|nr:AraC family transcriptional regulator [Solimonas aquatica]SEQ44148.1 AraC-type DNA-binding protein [Solimonas aquatica]
MTETLFVFDKRNYQDCQNSFRGEHNQEYYLGDYSIEAGSVIDVRAERRSVGSCSIIRLRSKSRLFFRRSWSHIREDATDVTVLWFVKRGRLCISHQCGYTVAKAGDFAITKSMTPFSIECQPDEDSVHEVLHVIVPAHVFRRFVAQDVRTGFMVPAKGRDFAIAERLLIDIFEDTGELKDHVAQLLMDSAISVLSDAIKDRDVAAPVRRSISDKRLQDVLRYIEIHLSDPKLSIATVAKGCGISPRYLSLLLKLHGTPFSTLVWDKRLKIAGQWLSASKSGETSVSEIAYRVGFKSPAHFSRMFKRAYNMSPRQYRLNGAVVEAAPQRESSWTLLTGNSQATH